MEVNVSSSIETLNMDCVTFTENTRGGHVTGLVARVLARLARFVDIVETLGTFDEAFCDWSISARRSSRDVNSHRVVDRGVVEDQLKNQYYGTLTL